MTQRRNDFHNWRRSIWSKGVALCFILLTIIGNIWFVMAFESMQAPIWLQIAFLGSMAALAFFAFGLLARQLYFKFGSRDDDDSTV